MAQRLVQIHKFRMHPLGASHKASGVTPSLVQTLRGKRRAILHALPLQLCRRSEVTTLQRSVRYPFGCAIGQRETTCISTGVTPSLVQVLRGKRRAILLALPLHLCKASEVNDAQTLRVTPSLVQSRIDSILEILYTLKTKNARRYPFTCATR